MVFSSFLFLFYFLPLTLALYYGAPRAWRLGILTVLSYIFYGWTNPLYVPLMWLSTTIDYIAGTIIAGDTRSPHGHTLRQRAALVISVSSNLALLGFFKYFNFGAEAYRNLMLQLGWSQHVPDSMWEVILPRPPMQAATVTVVYRNEAGQSQTITSAASANTNYCN